MSSWATMLKQSLGFSAKPVNEAPASTIEIEKDWNLIDDENGVTEIEDIFAESEKNSVVQETMEPIQSIEPKFKNSRFQRLHEEQLKNQKYPTHASSLRKRKLKNSKINKKHCFKTLPEKKTLISPKETPSSPSPAVPTHIVTSGKAAKQPRSFKKVLQLNQPKPGF